MSAKRSPASPPPPPPPPPEKPTSAAGGANTQPQGLQRSPAVDDQQHATTGRPVRQSIDSAAKRGSTDVGASTQPQGLQRSPAVDDQQHATTGRPVRQSIDSVAKRGSTDVGASTQPQGLQRSPAVDDQQHATTGRPVRQSIDSAAKRGSTDVGASTQPQGLQRSQAVDDQQHATTGRPVRQSIDSVAKSDTKDASGKRVTDVRQQRPSTAKGKRGKPSKKMILEVCPSVSSASDGTDGPLPRPVGGSLAKPQDGPLAKLLDGSLAKPKDGSLAKLQDRPLAKPEDVSLVKPQDRSLAKPQDRPLVKPQGGPLAKPEDGTSDGTDGPLPRPVGGSLAKPQDRSLAKPQDRSLAKPQDGPLAKPQDRSLAKPQDRSLAKPQDGPLAKPLDGSLAKPQDVSLAKPQDRSLAKPQDRSLAKPQDGPLAKPQDRSLAKPQDRSLAKPQDGPLAKPLDGSLVKPQDVSLAKPKDVLLAKPLDEPLDEPLVMLSLSSTPDVSSPVSLASSASPTYHHSKSETHSTSKRPTHATTSTGFNVFMSCSHSIDPCLPLAPVCDQYEKGVSLYTVTWNVGNLKKPPLFLEDLLTLTNFPLSDIYAVGLQEVNPLGNDGKEWVDALTDLMGSYNFVRIKWRQLQGMVTVMFAKRCLLHHCSSFESEVTKCGFGGWWGNKGGVSLRMDVCGVNFIVVNCHLAAHMNQVVERIEDYDSILDNQKFKTQDVDNILDHDYVFWMGDLNFRVETCMTREQVLKAIEKKDYKSLLQFDQLSNCRQEQLILEDFNEMDITFPPTFKFDTGTQIYDTSEKQRMPAWCDRVLWHVYNVPYDEFSLKVVPLEYRSHPSYTASDHKPVSATFFLTVYPKPPPCLVKFEPQTIWIRDEAVSFSYRVNRHCSTSSSDWIGLYRSDFTSFDKHVSFTSSVEGAEKNRQGVTATFSAKAMAVWPGRYCLCYMTKKYSLCGISTEFLASSRSDPPSTAAQEQMLTGLCYMTNKYSLCGISKEFQIR